MKPARQTACAGTGTVLRQTWYFWAFRSSASDAVINVGAEILRSRISKLLPGAAFGALAFMSIPALASTSTFIVSGEGEAVITTGAGTVQVVLTDLYVDPNTVADNISAFTFTLSNAPTGTPSINTSSSAQEVTVDGSGTPSCIINSNCPLVDPNWNLSVAGATTKLDVLVGGYAGPSETIIGAPGSNGTWQAGGSINGNGPHNPFLYESATFNLNMAGVTSATTVNTSSVIFQFGTQDGSGTVHGNYVPTATPEPATFGLFGGALLLLGFARKKVGGARL
jgi:hypothetical protein